MPGFGVALQQGLQIFGAEAGVLGDAREHFRADFNAVVKCPNIFAADGMCENDVRASLGFNGVADSEKRSENF